MPVDASIYSLIRPPPAPPNPIDQYTQLQQLRGLQDQSALHGLQRQKLEGDLAEESQFKDAFRTSVTDETPEARINRLIGISPTRGLNYQKSVAESTKAGVDLSKTRRHIEISYGRIHP